MATAPYDQTTPGYAQAYLDAPRDRSAGEHAFIWIAWALAAAFWGAVSTTFFGILGAAMRPSPVVGGVDAGGIGFLLMDVVGGLLLLGGALAFGSWMVAHRNRRLDPLTEAGTAAIYDRAERQEATGALDRSEDG